MRKFSEYATRRLDRSGINYFSFFIGILAFCILRILSLTPSGVIVIDHIPTLETMLLIFISLMLLIQWLVERGEIAKENKEAMGKKCAIEDYWKDTTCEDLTRIKESWLNKKLNSAYFANIEEISGIGMEKFWYEIFLGDQNRCGSAIHKEIKTNVCFRIASGDGDIVKIDDIDCLALLPNSNTVEILLKQIFIFIKDEYRRQKKLCVQFDHALNAIDDIHKVIKENILVENFQAIFRIFLSKEDFEVAGVILEGGEDKKLFLITAVKTANKEVVLFPTKTISDMFSGLQRTLND